jgi:branched-chain amino acid transport system ATP-binding protein
VTALLDATGVTKRFAGITALDGVDLSVEAGERVGLIGPNGAGKTTMFNCLLGVLRAEQGFIRLNGDDISRTPVHERARRGIGRTFQRVELFTDMTVREHLLIADRVARHSGRFWRDLLGLGGPKADEIARCDETLALLGLADLADARIERLSLGQGRLVEVGRALMTQPSLLLLDEPSSGLDRSETAALATALLDVQAERGFAILLVEHDVDLVTSFTSRCYVLDFGKLLHSGPTTDVMGSDVVRRAYVGDVS